MRRSPRARLAHALDRRFTVLACSLDGARAAVDRGFEQTASQDDAIAIRTELASVRQTLDAVLSDLQARDAEVRQSLRETHEAIATLDGHVQAGLVPLLRAVLCEDANNRRQLEALRSRPEYEDSFRTPDCLVSICVALRPDRVGLLLERALPSVLAQSHPSIEAVIVGDGFDPLTDPRLRALDANPNVRFGSLNHRITSTDPQRQWFTGDALPRQEARRMANGLWLADLDDDDALRPDAIERLLARARATHAEVTCGPIAEHEPGCAQPHLIAGFPTGAAPDWSGLGHDWTKRACTGALSHHALRCFTRQHVAGALGVPGDLFLTIRLARAGVRFAEIPSPVYDYYPSKLWSH